MTEEEERRKSKRVLLLHGNRQTGELLLGRSARLAGALDAELGRPDSVAAPDAPFLFHAPGPGEDADRWQRTWWQRRGDAYEGLGESLALLRRVWEEGEEDGGFEGVLGFSQGSRLAHLLALAHHVTGGRALPGLAYVVHYAGYGDVPLPSNLGTCLLETWGDVLDGGTADALRRGRLDLDGAAVDVPSLHVMGTADRLVPPSSGRALMGCYVRPCEHVHPGSHFLPAKRADVDRCLEFVRGARRRSKAGDEAETPAGGPVREAPRPDGEHEQSQVDEVTALSQIFPSEFELLSDWAPADEDCYDPDDYSTESRRYVHPIRYSITLQPQDDALGPVDGSLWPAGTIRLVVEYPPDYPDASPRISLGHGMNYHEFSMRASDALTRAVGEAVAGEAGSPCVMGAVYAARDFFEGGGLEEAANCCGGAERDDGGDAGEGSAGEVTHAMHAHAANDGDSTALRPSSVDDIRVAVEEGLAIASGLLTSGESCREPPPPSSGGKGGSWSYTIGLVGKPSAGKSTFFNAGTCFARQRNGGGGTSRRGDGPATMLGGASMAPHPFTTIDPNVGLCLVPVPSGSCPEEDAGAGAFLSERNCEVGSSHGRDLRGRRLVPCLLKDVAGLVPGAYRGRGKGNKFLDDLTDSDVLVHILDSSGVSDAEGNKICDGDDRQQLRHPIDDLEWIRNELVQWVYHNLLYKWESVVRRGRSKLIGMLSGYKQNQAFTEDVLAAVERFLAEEKGREGACDELERWSEADLHRLVSAFLGARFPMALALNKSDLPSSSRHVEDIRSALPLHGAHVGISMSAHSEMDFARTCLVRRGGPSPVASGTEGRVLDCLQSAMSLRRPVFVFPVSDMRTYEPLPGMSDFATNDGSLPGRGFVDTLVRSGGSPPTQWSEETGTYTSRARGRTCLRDCMMMKPGSTVEDVYFALKRLRAIDGEYVRAEAASALGGKPNLVTKKEAISYKNRIIHIMTTKRSAWQK